MSIQSDYYKERKRISRYISRLERAGAEVNLELPQVPKKITPASVRRLQRITPEKILSKTSVISEETGEYRTGRGVLGTIQRKEQWIGETQAQREARKKAEWEEYYRQKDLQNLKSETDRLVKENTQRFETVYPKQEDVIIDNVMDEFESAGYSYDANLDELYDALEKLDTFEPKDNWGKWYGERKRQQVKKLMQGINQAINRTSKSAVAETFNNNAREFNDVIDRAIYDSGGKSEMADIDNSIDNMINSLMGAMSYEEAEYYGE